MGFYTRKFMVEYLPSLTFPSYDCTLDPPMRAPADALWEVSLCIGAFVCSNYPQAST